MRPVEKGTAPQVYTRYQDAQADLIDRLGQYCSYCERQIETNLAVEHVQPKSLEPGLETHWENFLLGCVNCNSCKGNTPIVLSNFLWPDRDNTFLAFNYTKQGLVEVSSSLDPKMRVRAEALLLLVGLDKTPGHPDQSRRPTTADRRWLRRLKVWIVAERTRALYLDCQGQAEAVDHVVDCAEASGLFSIWMACFAECAEVQDAMIQAFPGTDSAAFTAVS